jgi:hypothetical protein
MYDVLTGLNPDPASLVNEAGRLAVSRVAHVGCTREASRAQNMKREKARAQAASVLRIVRAGHVRGGIVDAGARGADTWFW